MEPSAPAEPGDPTGLTDINTANIPGVSDRTGAPEVSSGPAAREGVMALVARLGVDGRRLRIALAALGEGRWWTLADLVRRTATSRRTVEALLREVDGELERSGDRFRLSAPWAGHEVSTLAPADPVAHLLEGRADLVTRMDELIAKAPEAATRWTTSPRPATPWSGGHCC